MANSLTPITSVNTLQMFIDRSQEFDVRPELYYTQQVLDMIQIPSEEYVYFRLATETPIPNKGQKLQLRRWSPLQAHTVPLVEGIPPEFDKSSVEVYTIPAYQYGRAMEFTDVVDFTTIDPVVSMYMTEYGIVAVETLDLLAREAMAAVSQPYFANQKPNFEGLTIADAPSITDLRLVILDFKKNLVDPRMGNKYTVIGSPDFYFDLVMDPLVQAFIGIENNSMEVFTRGQIPDMFNMSFQETRACPISGEFYDGSGVLSLRVVSLNPDGTANAYATIPSTNATVFSRVSGYVNDSRTGDPTSFIPDRAVWDLSAYTAPPAGPWKALAVNHIYVVGKDALVRTGLSGEGNVKTYAKGPGSAGTLDPIDQRQSIGFKINSVGFGSSRVEAIVDYMCCPSQSNV